MSEDHCVVCMDPLEWTGFGACGHKEACSRCVARLRFVLEDKRCMYCHQQQDAVFFTRYMGDFTARPGDFETLKDRAKSGEVQHLAELGGFFDDVDHYKYIKALCSYTHPSLARGNGSAPSFASLDQLKRRVQDNVKLHFCDLCLKGRKVFISEQVLYSKRDLDRHNRTGDDAGPLAEAGFKGHPPCHFCRTRFYDSNELYTHMERGHEHCFLCRRNNPNKYVYFKDYAELEGHFQKDHHPCPHPACLERRFVVFPGEAELKRHFAMEHGEDMRMSRAQRREALAVPIDLQFAAPAPAPRRGGRGGRGGGGDADDSAAAAAMAAAERPGVVIGGGAGLPQRGGRGGGAAGMRHSRSDPAMAAAVAASVDTAGAEAARRAQQQAQQQQAAQQQQPDMSSVTFNASDFPAVGVSAGSGVRTPGAPGGGVALGTWVASGSGGPSTSRGLAEEDFPELPTLSKAQKQRQKQKAKATAATLAARMGAAAAAPRVLNRAAPTTTVAAPAPASSGLAASRSAGNLAGGAAAGSMSDDDARGNGADDFPALDGGAGGASQQAHPSWVPVRSRAPRPGSAASSASSSAAAPRPSDFPALGGGRRQAAGAPAGRSAAAAQPTPAAAMGRSLSDAAAQAARQGGVSEELKAANRELIERIKAQLDDRGFASFREQSAAFMRGGLAAGAYHDLIVSLGLLPLVARLAELCPQAARREELLQAHRDFLGSSRAHDVAVLGSSWVPPEAALAAVRRVEQRASWACGACTLINAPSTRTCEVCGTPRGATPLPAAAAQPAAAAAAAGGGRTAAAVLATPSRYESLAAALTAGGPSSSSSISARPGSAGGPPAPAAPPRPSDFPALGGGSSSSFPALGGGAGPSGSGGAGPSSSADPEPEPAEAEEAAAAATGKGKKKKPVKQTLQQLLTSGKSSPGNAWSQPQRTAKLGAVPTVAQPKGAWGGKAGGGDKLAKELRATGLGER